MPSALAGAKPNTQVKYIIKVRIQSWLPNSCAFENLSLPGRLHLAALSEYTVEAKHALILKQDYCWYRRTDGSSDVTANMLVIR